MLDLAAEPASFLRDLVNFQDAHPSDLAASYPLFRSAQTNVPLRLGGQFLILKIIADFGGSDSLILAHVTNPDHIAEKASRKPQRRQDRKRLIKLPMEGQKMCKTIYTAAAAIALLSLGSYVSAQAGSATSAPSKYSHNAEAAANLNAPPQSANAQAADVAITEFSSSSVKSSVPKR